MDRFNLISNCVIIFLVARPCSNGETIYILNNVDEDIIVKLSADNTERIVFEKRIPPFSPVYTQRVYFIGGASYNVKVYNMSGKKIMEGNNYGYVTQPDVQSSFFTLIQTE